MIEIEFTEYWFMKAYCHCNITTQKFFVNTNVFATNYINIHPNNIYVLPISLQAKKSKTSLVEESNLFYEMPRTIHGKVYIRDL